MQRTARWISIALHPLVVLLLATAASVQRLPSATATRAVLIVAAVAAIPITLFMLWQVRSGRWQNVDASRPQERPRLFVVGLCVMAVLAAVLFRTPSIAYLSRGVFAAAAIFLVSWALLRWVKISLHVAIGALAAVSLLRSAPTWGIALCLALPFLAWSRITLKRHTLLEIALGAVLGSGVGWAMIAL